ncbi:hypothetical protein [Ligilactobacillus salivarius]|uniref:hypothetical protein n=1 Tax=Ligilactobacillus salivarius TaxID=1624 RepID=UPI003655323A
MPNSVAQLAIKAHDLVYISTYVSCGLFILAIALLLFQKVDKHKARPIVKYMVEPIKVLVVTIMVLALLAAGFYLGVSSAFASAYSKPVVYTVQEVNKNNIVVKSDKGKVQKIDYDIAKKISKKQGFKKGQKVDLGSKELVKSTPKDVRKLLDKYPI